MYETLASKLDNRQLIILDGGTGTDIQRRGVPMNSEFWCAMANLTHPESVREVHEDYIRAGAEIVTANTYASSPLSFSHHGREDEIENIDREAVRLARDAVDRVAAAPVAVAGSISTMPPIIEGTDQAAQRDWQPEHVRPLYGKKAQTLAEAGCDLLIMEMMRDLEASLWATEAAVATGLPVWVGISVERDDEGALVSFDNHTRTLAELTRGLMDTGASVALVMHNEMSTTDDALGIMQAEWNGPVGAYPEAGYFTMPNWVFNEVAPDEFVTSCRRWRESGATILGGCCGITPAHIEALARAVRAGEIRA